MRTTRARTALAASLGVGALAGLTACGTGGGGRSASASRMPAATAVATAYSSASAADQPALAAYKAMWADVRAAGETSNYNDPRLTAHLAGTAYATTSENMAVDKAEGIIGLGQPELLDPTVVTVTSTTVTIRDCMSDEHWLKYYATTHKPVDNVPGGRRYVAATLTDEGGTWKVTTLDVRGEGSC